MQRRYVTIDVFTDRPFGGNPLAVVLDAEGLGTAQMQAIASEFNYSETTFVLPPVDPAHTAAVRIFTPASELPFAGHPNIGTALVLANRAAEAAGGPPHRMMFEEAAGLVAIVLEAPAGGQITAELTAPQPLSRGGVVTPAELAGCVSLVADDVLTGAHTPSVASVGLPFLFAELATRAALRAADPDMRLLDALLGVLPAAGVLLYTGEGVEDGCDVSARMFSPHGGIGEDPATGSANVALAALLAALSPEDDIDLDIRVAQGIDMGRPSLLRARAIKRRGGVIASHVGGGGVEIMHGTLSLAGF